MTHSASYSVKDSLNELKMNGAQNWYCMAHSLHDHHSGWHYHHEQRCQIKDEGVHPVVCMMNKINMIFITVKHNLYLYLK
jgi:hypothetical protein